MFLRPTQSEAVMLQFGDLLPVTDGDIGALARLFIKRASFLEIRLRDEPVLGG